MKEKVHYTIRERMQRVKDLQEHIKQKQKTTIDEILAYMFLKYGLSERKILEYLKQLSAAGFIKMNGLTGEIEYVGG